MAGLFYYWLNDQNLIAKNIKGFCKITKIGIKCKRKQVLKKTQTN